MLTPPLSQRAASRCALNSPLPREPTQKRPNCHPQSGLIECRLRQRAARASHSPDRQHVTSAAEVAWTSANTHRGVISRAASMICTEPSGLVSTTGWRSAVAGSGRTTSSEEAETTSYRSRRALIDRCPTPRIWPHNAAQWRDGMLPRSCRSRGNCQWRHGPPRPQSVRTLGPQPTSSQVRSSPLPSMLAAAKCMSR